MSDTSGHQQRLNVRDFRLTSGGTRWDHISHCLQFCWSKIHLLQRGQLENSLLDQGISHIHLSVGGESELVAAQPPINTCNAEYVCTHLVQFLIGLVLSGMCLYLLPTIYEYLVFLLVLQ